MVTGIWDVAVVAIITDGAEAVVITMDGTGDGTTDAINSELEAALVTGGFSRPQAPSVAAP